VAAAPAPVLPILQPEPSPVRLWKPRRVWLTQSAGRYDYARSIAQRASDLGATIVELRSDRLPRVTAEANRNLYAEAKGTLALVVAPPSSFKLQPIPPSADWQFHLAQGCPAHCQYCYLAGSLSGPPITRVYANLDPILENLKNYLGKGTITSRSGHRSGEGTTFECSCYTDPLALEHLTGGLARSISYFGGWDEAVQLRWTTKFDNVEPLLALDHRRRTRVRFSLNADSVSRPFEGGTANVTSRLAALRRMAFAGYPIGLTIAPIMDVPDFSDAYTRLLQAVGNAVEGAPNLDLTAELITHRFTPTSKAVLLDWYPKTPLDLEEQSRAAKRTKFGSLKYVYPADRMKAMRGTLEGLFADLLPAAKILYWT
jgi:spore photoproduct lyase